MRHGAGARWTTLIVAAAATILLLVGVVGVVLLRATGVGSGGLSGGADRLEDWIGAQIVGIADAYLVPRIAYDELDYEAPGEVTLTGVTFTAPDGTVVLALERMDVTLAEVPKIGAPIVIERLSLDRPTVRLMGEARADGSSGFKGLSPIIEGGAEQEDGVPEGFRLSNVLRLRRIDIREGAVEYDAGDGSAPMALSGITTTVLAAPASEGPGWYTIDLDTAAGPLASLSVDGLLSLDTWTARLDDARLAGQLTPETAGALPPAIQQLVAAYRAEGSFSLAVTGTLPLTDPASGQLLANFQLEEFRIVSGEYQLPIESAAGHAELSAGRATLTSLRAELLGGAAEAYGEADLLATGRPATLAWTIDGVDLTALLVAGDGGEGTPKLAGTLTGSGTLATELGRSREALSGSGELHVRDGRLGSLPTLRRLAALMDIATGRLLHGALSHTADVAFDLAPAGFEVRSLDVTTEAIAARGRGAIGFDGTLDLTVNAGPMEKVQSLLGRVGDGVGAVTDRLLRYRVRGRIGAPEVTVEPLGLGG